MYNFTLINFNNYLNLYFMKKRNLLISLTALAALVLSIVIYSSCKGPKGDTGPNGNDGLNGIDANSFCKTCHTVANWTAVETQLEASKHGDKTGNMADEGYRKDCARCHSSQGYLETLQNGLDTPTVNYGTNSPYWGDYTLTCEVCHTFHGTLQESDFPNYALRKIDVFPSIFKPSVSFDLGGSNACVRCHQNRANTSTKVSGTTVDLDTIADATMVQITSQRFGGHHGPQGQLFAGVGMGEYEITGSATYTNSTNHSSLICGDCHVLSTANTTNKTGGHYYKLAERDETTHATIAGTENVSKCVTCHTGATNHNINNVQTDVKALMLTIETKLITQGMMKNNGNGTNGYGGVNTDGYILGDNGTSNASSSNPRTVTAKQAKAIFNFKCIYEDYSYGVHNPNYIKALLTNANEAL